MKIALTSDEPYPIHDYLIAALDKRGHEVVPFGSILSRADVPWPTAARDAALAIAKGECDEGIFLCWSGTGISIAANKVKGIRAALCLDTEMVRDARIWNHANVLCLSNRLLTESHVDIFLEAWFTTPMDDRGRKGVELLEDS